MFLKHKNMLVIVFFENNFSSPYDMFIVNLFVKFLNMSL